MEFIFVQRRNKKSFADIPDEQRGKIYRSKAGEVRTREGWQLWINDFYSYDDRIIKKPTDKWERVVRVLGLTEVETRG